MYFETDRQLLTKIELGTGKTITYEYDSNGRPKRLRMVMENIWQSLIQ